MNKMKLFEYIKTEIKYSSFDRKIKTLTAMIFLLIIIVLYLYGGKNG